MDKDLGYGRKLNGTEYDQRMVALHTNLPSNLSSEMERQVRRQELDITIDYRLGCNFPKEKREKLWEIQERIEKKRLRLIAKYLLSFVWKKLFIKGTQDLARELVAEYATVLSAEEMEQYFGKTEMENPTLPINPENFK